SPSARWASAMAYDSARGRTVLFGGTNAADLDDTWEWDGSQWLRATPAVSPPARRQHAMAYDIARDRVVLFGGFGGGNRFADTWEWDGSQWTNPKPQLSPPARLAHA